MPVRVACSIKDRACRSGHRVAGLRACKREDIRRIVMLFEERRMTGGLCESAIESARAPGAGDLHIGAVKREAPGLVNIEPVVQYAPDDASGLADAEDQNLVRYGLAFKWVIAEIGKQIANSREPRTCD